MSSTYDDTFGGEPLRRMRRGNVLLQLVGLTVGRVGEYRDAWVEHDENDDLRIVVYVEAVTGPEVGAMRLNANYLHEYRSEVVPPHMAVYFRLPDIMPADTRDALVRNALVEPVDTDARWIASFLDAAGAQ